MLSYVEFCYQFGVNGNIHIVRFRDLRCLDKAVCLLSTNLMLDRISVDFLNIQLLRVVQLCEELTDTICISTNLYWFSFNGLLDLDLFLLYTLVTLFARGFTSLTNRIISPYQLIYLFIENDANWQIFVSIHLYGVTEDAILESVLWYVNVTLQRPKRTPMNS